MINMESTDEGEVVRQWDGDHNRAARGEVAQ